MYVKCFWCGAVTNSAQSINLDLATDDAWICKKDAALVPAAQTRKEAHGQLKALLKALPYPSKRGYTFQPHRFTGDGPVKGVTSLKAYPERGYFPFFATSGEAAAHLIALGIEGNVQRYQITPDLIHRTHKIHGFNTELETVPWLTAGVTEVVSASVTSAPISIMSLFSSEAIKVHTPSGIKEVGGFGELTEADWERLEGEDGY